MWAPAGGLEPFVRRLESRHSKIHNLDVVIPVQQDILRFQISMTDIEPMTIRQAGDELPEYADSFCFREKSMG